ncbi:maternal effect protein oskar [Anastrepha ludens]|uniref:maternal effect protein oskar n=1 Tax=Anastrepha ludens TaxID=28586 RepID=UPI0023AF062F|nr:maternal effect protein oskar [Anastrepha ludens]
MTIMHEAFLELRGEFPDLDAEVRSILLARSQEGATISDIKEDYRKNTGIKFPIYQNITEFLLSVPYVTAFCNENGKLIFNVRPSTRTKHIYDLVQQQKPQQQQSQTYKPKQIESQCSERKRFDPCPNINHKEQNNACHELWRSQNKQFYHRRNYQHINKNQHINNNKIDNENCMPITTDVVQTEKFQEKITNLPIIDNQKSVGSDTEESNSNNYYQDNCNHLFNRLYNQPKVPLQSSGYNLSGNYQTKFNSQTSQFGSIKQQNYVNMNNQEKHLNDIFKEPVVRSISRSAGRPSSPFCTKSSRYEYDSVYASDSDYEAHLLDFPLLGDDFFLFLARMELRCKFKKNDKVLQSGLCVSGQTIVGAIRRIKQLENQCKSIIVNIGSVDIMKGRPLVQIEHDFRELVNLLFKKGFTPILTTLAPLANFAHDKQVKFKLERFNQFIKKEAKFLVVMDIWACLVNERGYILFDCFQNEPRMVSGTSEPYVFWNKIGRQRVLQLIESLLEY